MPDFVQLEIGCQGVRRDLSAVFEDAIPMKVFSVLGCFP